MKDMSRKRKAADSAMTQGSGPTRGEQTTQSTDEGNTVVLCENNHRAILEYLKWNCDAIQFHDVYPKIETRLTPVALDGASGVGKTQQAFALLKTRQKIVYVLMVSTTSSAQPIYKEMDKLQGNALLLEKVNRAVQALKNQTATNNAQDPLSEAFISKQLDDDALKAVVLHLFQHCIEYKESDKDQGQCFYFPNWNRPYIQANHPLRNTLLFLDEALPKGHTKDHTEKLRFMRNLGCVLGMQVVAAGTASTVANTIKQKVPRGSKPAGVALAIIDHL